MQAKKKVYFLLLASSFLCNQLFSQQTCFPFSDGEKWGVIDQDYHIIHPAELDEAFTVPKYNSEIIKKNNGYGLVDTSGRYALPPEYDSIHFKYDHHDYSVYQHYVVYKGKQLNFYDDEQGGLFKNGWFEQVKTNRTWFETPFMILKKNTKYGLVKFRPFRELVPFVYEDLFFIGDFMYPNLAEQGSKLPQAFTGAIGYRGLQTYFVIYKRNGLYGILEVTGTEITPPIYTTFDFVLSTASDKREVFLKCIGTQRTDYYNFMGKLVDFATIKNTIVPNDTKFNDPDPYAKREPLISGEVMKNVLTEKDNGKYLLTQERVTNWQTTVKNKWSIKGFDKLSLISLTYPVDSVLLIAEKNGRSGIINQTGKVIVPLEYDSLTPHYTFDRERYDGWLFLAAKNKKVGLISVNGNEVIKLEYDSVREVRSGKPEQLILIKGNTMQLADLPLKKISLPGIPFKQFKGFEDGIFERSPYLLATLSNGQAGYLDIKTGKFYIPAYKDQVVLESMRRP